jgi:hypothetical protein
VGTAYLVDGSVTTAKIADANVTQAKLASGVAGNGPAFSAYNVSNQSFTANTWTKTTLPTEEFDTANCFDSSTNYRFTPNVAGYYLINGSVNIAGTNSSTQRIIEIYKNGSVFKISGTSASTNAPYNVNVNSLVYLNGTTDYIEFYVSQGNATLTSGSGQSAVYFYASMVRAA